MALICFFYVKTTTKLYKRSFSEHIESGLQSQTDLRMAGLITKKYNIGAYYEFFNLRNKLWKTQIIVFTVFCLLAFPTTMIGDIREKLDV